MSDQSKLEDLLVDEDELNEELLTGTVSRYAQIGRNSGDLIPDEQYNDLNSREKIVVALLAQKARYELALSEEEWLGPTEISELSGVKTNTVYPAVRDLANEGVLGNENSKYMIPVSKS
jgi:DNA-directed RNA polymerase specialized sigma24 family protein